MRGTKAKQARRTVYSMGGEINVEQRYGIMPWGQVVCLGGRNFYQHLKRELRGHRGVHRYTTMAGAQPERRILTS